MVNVTFELIRPTHLSGQHIDVFKVKLFIRGQLSDPAVQQLVLEHTVGGGLDVKVVCVVKKHESADA